MVIACYSYACVAKTKLDSTGELAFNRKKNSEIAVLEVRILQKFSLPSTMVGALTQSYIKNGGIKIWLHKTLMYIWR